MTEPDQNPEWGIGPELETPAAVPVAPSAPEANDGAARPPERTLPERAIAPVDGPAAALEEP